MIRVKVTKGYEKGRTGWVCKNRSKETDRFVNVLFLTHGGSEQVIMLRKNVRVLPNQ